MENMNELKNKIMAIAFIITLSLFAIISDKNLINYYVNDVKYNAFWEPELGRKNETEYNTVFWKKESFIDVNGAIRTILGQREMNSIVKLDSGQLARPKERIEPVILKEEAQNIAHMYNYCKEVGIPYVYIATPDPISPYNPGLPSGINCYNNENTDVFLKELEILEVPYIDLRKEFHEDGMDQYNYFSKTDHHWNAYGGYYAYLKIAEWMEDNNIVFDEEKKGIENYDVVVYKNKLLGSMGQRTGKYFAGSDDFYIFEPKYDTSLSIYGGETTGTYKKLLIDDTSLQSKKPEFIYDEVYNNTQDVINNNQKNSTSILLIGDSFSRVVNPFLILSVSKFYWRSSYESYNITEELISNLKPDAIILIQSPYNNLGVDYKYSYLVE